MSDTTGNDLSARLTTELIKEVSERKHVESLISLFVKYAPGAIAMFDKEMRYQVASDRWYKDYQLSNQDIAGRSLYELSGHFKDPIWKAHLSRGLNGEQLRNDEDKIVTKDGLIVWFKWEILPWYDKDGAVGGIILSTEVLNERKQLEIDLRKSNQLLGIALNAGGVGFWHWTQMDNRLEWDDKMFEIFEVDKIKFDGNGDMFYDLILEEDRMALKGLLARVINELGEYHTKYRVQSASGIKTIREHGKVFNEEGTLRMTGICQDVTEEEQIKLSLKDLNTKLEEKIQERTTALNEANQELKSLTYSLSNDLREPLRAIKAYIEIIQEDYHDLLDEDGIRYLNRIIHNSGKMTKLIDDLLAFSRIIHQRFSIEEIDLTQLIAGVVAVLPEELRKRVVLDELPAIQGDRITLSQLFDNLIDNALKFSKSASNQTVHISSTTAAGYVRISIKDFGVGFEMVDYHRLFKPFQKLHPENDFVGNGVGLALCKKIVDSHKGDIVAEAIPGAGAVFTVELPLPKESMDI